MVGVLQHALMITGFVFVMMLVVEYVNVLTQGSWQEAVMRRKWGQYLLADSRRQFIVIKSVNFIVGAVVGALLMALEQ